MNTINTSAQIQAVPVVVDVFIVGEPIVGGTVVGSYKYQNEAENPEGLSRYEWTLDGKPVATSLQFLVIADYENRSLVFTVTPVAASGEFGRAVSSEAKLVTVGFQNISDEENINSFMKQHGNFSFYTPEPADRVFVSTGGAFSLIDNHSQDVFIQGQDDYGSKLPPELRIYLENNPATIMFSTERDFAALVPLGRSNQLLAWGKNIPSSQDLTKLRGIRAVYSNGGAFVYVYKSLSADNKWLGAIGGVAFGATVPDWIHLKLINDPPRAVYATFSAFVVISEAGKAYAWGDPQAGGTISKDAQALLDRMKVKRVIANMSAFCAIDAEGVIVTWGSAINGGTIPADRLATILDQGGVKSVIAARAAFCAVTKGRAKAVSWGNAAQGGNMTGGAADLAARGNIVLCRAATWAFCMVNAFGQADAWGVANSGGTIPNNRTHFAAPVDIEQAMTVADVREKISALFHGRMAQAGVEMNDESRIGEAAERLSGRLERIGPNIIIEDGEISIYANDSSFLLIAADEDGYSNQVLVWGQANGGGTMPDATRQVLMASQITSVYCTNGAYGVISNQGRVTGVVTVWGATLAQLDAGEIPKTPPDIAEKLRGGIVELYSIKRQPPVNPTPTRVDPSFAARHEDGTYVLWGGNVDNQVFDPREKSSPFSTETRRSLSPERTSLSYR